MLFTAVLHRDKIACSMDGCGASRDNVFGERLWRSVKYEEANLQAMAWLGSGLVDQSQKMTVAARAMADKKTVGHLS